MKLKIKTLMVGAGALALTACGDGPVGKFWYQEAGAYIDEGGFGNPTMNNLLAQMCAGQAKGYIVPEPVVVLDPKSAPDNPAYYRGQVRCSGQLNGKYAEVIFREYISSAVPQESIEGGGISAIEGASGG
ncbi:MAG: hypothetical protein RIE24_23980 [Silicimonas sp.]|uniref:hypothetical protein n=1 Tax=Marinovum algicola TaxID=42444 RepID=UPI0032ED5963